MGGRKRGEMKFLLLWESMGIFCILAVFQRYLSNACTIHTKYYLCTDNVCRRAPSPCGDHRPLGWGEGELKTQKIGGGVSFVHRTATISIFCSDAKCSAICTAQTCAHSGIEPSRSAKAFLQGGPKSSKNFEFFTISRLYIHISQKLLKIEAYEQCMQKRFIPSPIQLSHLYGPIAHGVLQGGPKIE